MNEDGRGLYLGLFETDDKVLAIFKNGTFYTTSFDLVNKYQGDVLKIEKFDPNKTYTALYWDASVKAFYIKRFSFVLSDNTPVSFIAEGRSSYLVALSDDRHPQVQVTFAGKYAHREPEKIDAEEYIAKKGIAAKGKKCHSWDLKKVEFIEPLVKPEDFEEEKPEAEPENLAGEIDMSDIIDAPDEIVIPDIDMSQINVPEVDDGEDLTLF